MDSNDPKVQALATLIGSVADLTRSECWDRATTKKAASAANATMALAKLLGVPLSRSDAYRLIECDEPDAPDPSLPLKGARIVGDHLYSVAASIGNNFPVAAVRRRKDDQYEVAYGYEKYGYSSSSGFSGYDWHTLIGLYASEDEAVIALKSKWPASHKTRKKG